MTLSSKQFYRNSAWTFIEVTLYPLLMLLATPVFIKYLGIEQYGLWMLVGLITQGINVLNIGVGDTIIRIVSQHRAENKPSEIRAVFMHNFSLALFLCLAACLLGLVLYATGLIQLFYKSDNYELANTLLLLTSVSGGIKFVEVATLSMFKAFERFDINSKLLLLSKNSVVLCNLAMVLAGASLVSVMVLTVIINALNLIVQLLVLHKFNPTVLRRPGLEFFDRKASYFRYNFWYWLQSSIALAGFLTDKLAVAWFTDIKTLGYYYIASMIGANIHNFFLAFGGFIFPRVSFRASSGSTVLPLYYTARSLIALPGWLLTLGLLLFGDPVFKLWLGAETYLNCIYFIKLYLVFEAGMLLIITPFYFINGTQTIRLNSLFEIVIRLSHFLAMLLGYKLGGVNGIVYGLMLSTFINVPFQYLLFHKKVLNGADLWQSLLVIAPVACLLGLIVFQGLVYKLALIIVFALVCKLIYFDPGKKHTKDIFSGAQA
jgi:O-antigen/teichoic acid export membrane protein